jgi:hypothetical protein
MSYTIVDPIALDDEAQLFCREDGGWPRHNWLFGCEH